jgi:uncharacterized protein YgbK (DUF1537 family)
LITVVLDDDPTGTQAVADVPVVLDWDDDLAWDELREDDKAVHVLTNSRAYDTGDAARLVEAAASAAHMRLPHARIILRGDSTLRAHLWEEYDAVRSIVAPHRHAVPHLLVPALPAAGRVTSDGVHYLVRDGVRIPLHKTEYAQDTGFAYSTSKLAAWAEERSGGRFTAKDAVHVSLDQLRSNGPIVIAAALSKAARHLRPALVVPDAESETDLELIAAGLQAAEQDAMIIVRCAPAFAATLTGTTATDNAPLPGTPDVLVVCGSFVSTTTAQLAELARVYPSAMVQARVARLAGPAAEAEIEQVAARANARIDAEGLAIVATERQHDRTLVARASQLRIATGLAEIVRRVPVGVVIAKGGITSAVVARAGLAARAARVLGPILPGVSCWRLNPTGANLLIVPGNVGGPNLLLSLLDALAFQSARAQC